MEHGYDVKCEELARHFLEDGEVAANVEDENVAAIPEGAERAAIQD